MPLMMMLLSAALAQEWENPCKARPDLKAQVAAGELNSVGAVEGPDFVAIRSVYAGKKWQDTCISEIRTP